MGLRGDRGAVRSAWLWVFLKPLALKDLGIKPMSIVWRCECGCGAYKSMYLTVSL